MNKSKLRKLWIGLGILILLTPVGLILPGLFGAGGAWGEWDASEIREITGYLPEGLKKLSDLWSAPVSDYGFAGWSKGVKAYAGYLISGVLGVAIVVAAAYILGKLLKRGER
ncbi:MAG: cobalamin biosynthesis protein [Nitrospirae bacterium]|nr:cobalamin biosynthesis protein [Nitrospirota bacterium]